MKYLVVLERGRRNYSAYLPDIPGCIATGKTKAECMENMRSALAIHLDGLREDGASLPPARADAKLVRV